MHLPSPFHRSDPFSRSGLSPVWVIAPALVCGLLAIVVWRLGINQQLFISLNGASVALAPDVWAGLTLCGSVPGAIALLAPTIKTRPRWLASALLAAPLAMLFSEGGKRYFDIMRPAGVLPPDSFQLIGQKIYVYAFPSGHAITAFCVAAVIALTWPNPARRSLVAIAALALAGLVAFSRIAVGAHWPLDLLVGAAGGWLAGALGVWITHRTDFLQRARGVRIMASIALTASLALLFLDLGQPEVRLFRIGLGAWGIGGAAAALMADREANL